MFTRVEIAATAMVLSVGGCDHSQPFSYAGPAPLGPLSSATPRQITFNSGDDRFPSVQGGLVAYAFRAPERTDHDWCVAILPDTGGQRVHELCPPGPPDGFVDSYRYPAASPDTQRMVFWKEHGLLSNTVPATRSFQLVSWSDPSTLTTLLDAPYTLPDSTRGNSVREVTWPAGNTLRFIAGLEVVDLFTTDTIFTAYGVAELDLTSRALTLIPGTAGAATYANAADGGVWIMSPLDGRRVVHLAPGATSGDTVATFPFPVEQLANAGGTPAGVELYVTALGIVAPLVGYVSPGDTLFHQLFAGATPAGVAANAASPVVVAPILRGPPGGPGGNLWMVAK